VLYQLSYQPTTSVEEYQRAPDVSMQVVPWSAGQAPENPRESAPHLNGDRKRGARAPGGMTVSDATIAHLTETSFDEAVVEHSALVVDFWAPWCGPCRAIAPTLEALGQEYAGRVAIAKVNVDEQPILASRYQVRSIPTMLFIKDGKVVDQLVGAVPKAQLTKRMDALL
jgi:thioredoxin